MAYGLLFTASFVDIAGQPKSLKLYKDDYTGESYSAVLGPEAVSRIYAGNQQDKFQTIVGSSCEVSLIVEQAAGWYELITSSETALKVELLYADAVRWTGYVLPDQFTQVREYTNYPLKLLATDRLAALQDINFDDAGTPYSGRQTALYWLVEILTKTGLELPIRSSINLYSAGMSSGTTNDPLAQVYVDPARFIDSEGNPMDCFTVLEALLKPFNAVIRQADNCWDIFRPTDATETTVYRRTYNAAGTYQSTDTITPLIMSTAASESGGELYNKSRQRADTAGATNMENSAGLLAVLEAIEGWSNAVPSAPFEAFETYQRADLDGATGTESGAAVDDVFAGIIAALQPLTYLSRPVIGSAVLTSLPAAREFKSVFDIKTIGNLVPDGDFERNRWDANSGTVLLNWDSYITDPLEQPLRSVVTSDKEASYAVFLPTHDTNSATAEYIEFVGPIVKGGTGLKLRIAFAAQLAGLTYRLAVDTLATVRVQIRVGSNYFYYDDIVNNGWDTDPTSSFLGALMFPGWLKFNVETTDIPADGQLYIRLYRAIAPFAWSVSRYGIEYDNFTCYIIKDGEVERAKVNRLDVNTAITSGSFVLDEQTLMLSDGDLSTNPSFLTLSGGTLTDDWFRRGVTETRGLQELFNIERLNAWGAPGFEIETEWHGRDIEASDVVIFDGRYCTIADLRINERNLNHQVRLIEIPDLAADVTRTTTTTYGAFKAQDTISAAGNDANTQTAAVTDHGNLDGLSDDDHAQYMHLNLARTVTAKHTVNQFTLSNPGTNGTDAVRADRSIATTAPLTGGGSLTGDRTLALSIVSTNLRVNGASLDTIQNIDSAASPAFTGLTLSSLTASRLMASNGSKALVSVASLTAWIAGTAKRVTVSDDGDGSVTLSGPQDLDTVDSPTFAGLTITNNVTAGGYLQRSGFVEGLTGGSGWRLGNWSSQNRIEVDAAVVRGPLVVKELIAFQLRSLQGNLMISPAQARVHSVSGTAGSETIVIKDPDGNALNPFVAGDVLAVQVFSPNNTTVVKRLFRKVSSVSGLSIVLTTVTGAPADTGTFAENDSLIQIYSETDSTRRASIYFTVSDSNNPRQSVYDGVSAYSEFLNTSKERVRVGNLNGIGDIATQRFGFFAGDENGRYITIDATNGIRILNGASGDAVIMKVDGTNLQIGSSTQYLRYDGTTISYKGDNIDMDGMSLKIKSLGSDQFIKMLNGSNRTVLIENSLTSSYTPDISASASSSTGTAGAEGFTYTSSSITPVGAGKFNIKLNAQLVYGGVDAHQFDVYVDGSTNGGSSWDLDILGAAGFDPWQFSGTGSQSYNETRYLGLDQYVSFGSYNRIRIRIVETTPATISGNVTSAAVTMTEYQPLTVMNYFTLGQYANDARYVRFENGMLSFSASLFAASNQIPILVDGELKYLTFT